MKQMREKSVVCSNVEVRYLSVFDQKEVDEYEGFPSKTWNRNACL